MATDPTGLTTSSGGNINFETAVAAIAKLRDVLGGTSSGSVENTLTRSPTAYTSSVNSTGPVLFAVNSAAVSFVRSPYQVCVMQAAIKFEEAFRSLCFTVQVLDIVYFSDKTTPGGFFPHGVNGKCFRSSCLSLYQQSCCNVVDTRILYCRQQRTCEFQCNSS